MSHHSNRISSRQNEQQTFSPISRRVSSACEKLFNEEMPELEPLEEVQINRNSSSTADPYFSAWSMTSSRHHVTDRRVNTANAHGGLALKHLTTCPRKRLNNRNRSNSKKDQNAASAEYVFCHYTDTSRYIQDYREEKQRQETKNEEERMLTVHQLQNSKGSLEKKPLILCEAQPEQKRPNFVHSNLFKVPSIIKTTPEIKRRDTVGRSKSEPSSSYANEKKKAQLPKCDAVFLPKPVITFPHTFQTDNLLQCRRFQTSMFRPTQPTCSESFYPTNNKNDMQSFPASGWRPQFIRTKEKATLAQQKISSSPHHHHNNKNDNSTCKFHKYRNLVRSVIDTYDNPDLLFAPT